NIIPGRAPHFAWEVKFATPSSENVEGGGHETSPPKTIPASGRGRCRTAGGVAHRDGASLSVATGALDRRLSGRRRGRYRRAANWSMAVGAARPAIRDREPARCQQQYCRRGGCSIASRWLHASFGHNAGERN